MRWVDDSYGVVLSITIILIIERLQTSCTYMRLPFVMFTRFVFIIRGSKHDSRHLLIGVSSWLVAYSRIQSFPGDSV